MAAISSQPQCVNRALLLRTIKEKVSPIYGVLLTGRIWYLSVYDQSGGKSDDKISLILKLKFTLQSAVPVLDFMFPCGVLRALLENLPFLIRICKNLYNDSNMIN